VKDVFGDPFSCSASNACAVGGMFRLQRHSNLASFECSPLCSILPLLSSGSGCCTSIVSVPQESMEGGVYEVSIFLARGEVVYLFSSFLTFCLCIY
jgi:hypothetical protein